MFVGTFPRSVDPKGRLLVPAEMVRELGASDRKGYYLAPGDRCVLLFTRSHFHRMAEGLSSPTPFVHFDFNRVFFGQAAYRPADSMGRILLPETLREGAGIGGEAVLIGCGQYAEIWGKERVADGAIPRMSPEEVFREHRARTGGAGGQGPGGRDTSR